MARFVFIVQGEGRGHMSQSLAMRQFLERHNHTLELLYLGTGPFRNIPDYFMGSGEWVLKSFSSPNFVHTRDRRGIRILKSFIWNLRKAPRYRKEIRRLVSEIEKLNPDYVINFYDLVGSFVIRKLPDHITKICISHHFYLGHKDFELPSGSPLQRLFLKTLNRIMSSGCDRIGALSFRKEISAAKSDVTSINRVHIYIIPPLIRDEFKMLKRTPGKRDLVYLLHSGFLSEFIAIAEDDPEFRADIFLDAMPDHPVPPNLELFLPDSTLFSKKLQSCNRLITTAGFDLIAEAALLSIPVMATPARNHYEQQCNAVDMQNAGFGIRVDRFTRENIDLAQSYDNHPYLEWINQSEKLLLQLIEK